MAPSPPTYTRHQLIQYFTCANNGKFSGEDRLKYIEQTVQNDPLAALADLQRTHLATIKFANLSLHYTTEPSISLEPDVILHRLAERGLGGYCMENTGLLLIVLRSLGYTVYPTGARVSNAATSNVDDGGYGGWSHMALIVTLDEGRYMVDAGMGSTTPVKPLRLVEDGDVLIGISPAQIRLRKDHIANNTNRDSDQRMWIVENRFNPESKWLPAYCFSELEFTQKDFEVMNFYTSSDPKLWFSFRVICSKMIMNEAGDEIIGLIILLDNEVKKRVHGVTEERKALTTEGERVAALEKWLGVHLRKEEIEGIRGKVTELPRS